MCGGELGCSSKVKRSCSTSCTCRLTRVKNLMISLEWLLWLSAIIQKCVIVIWRSVFSVLCVRIKQNKFLQNYHIFTFVLFYWFVYLLQHHNKSTKLCLCPDRTLTSVNISGLFTSFKNIFRCYVNMLFGGHNHAIITYCHIKQDKWIRHKL